MAGTSSKLNRDYSSLIQILLRMQSHACFLIIILKFLLVGWLKIFFITMHRVGFLTYGCMLSNWPITSICSATIGIRGLKN